MTYTIAVCTVKTPDDGHRNCPKHVEFHSKNKFEKLVHLVGFRIIKVLNLSYSNFLFTVFFRLFIPQTFFTFLNITKSYNVILIFNWLR